MKKENINFKRLMTFAIVASMCLVVVPTVSADIPTEMVAYWKLDEGSGSIASDETANANDGTLSGGKFGNALEFDGVDDYVNVPDNPTLDITGNITLEAWIFINSFSTSAGYHMYIIGKDSAGQRSYGIGVDLTWQKPQKPFVIIFHPGGGYKIAWGTSQLVTNQWYHIAGVFDESDDELTLYVNGVPQSIQAITSTVNPGTADLRIGGRQYAGSECYFNGLIDEVRISDSVRYSSSFTPQTSAFTNDVNTVALWHFDESVGTDVFDETTNDIDGTIVDATWAGPTWTTGKIGNALKFDGVDDYVNIPDDDSLSFGDGISTDSPFSISAWVYMENSIIKQRFVSKADSFNPADGEYLLTTDFAGRFGFFLTDKSLGSYPFIGRRCSILPSTNQWYYVVGTYNGSGSSSGIKLYVDGIQVDDTDDSRPYEEMENTNKPLYLGKYGDTYLDGMIDEVAIFDKELSTDEISKFYCLGENFGVGYCESPTLTYTGGLVFSATTDVVLEATLLDSEGTGMSGYNVEFFFNGSSVGTNTTGSDGVAILNIYTKAVNVYEVYAEVYCSQSDPALLAVYDPTEGFVTGGGWIDSPAGAYVANPSAEGKANFGFVSKYKKGQSIPTGNTEFQFKAGDLNFHSSDYDWLVITGGNKAMYKGTGTINDDGSYKFMITAYDDNSDTFRIKIWEEDEFGVETIIYDNGANTPLGGGQIKIHQN